MKTGTPITLMLFVQIVVVLSFRENRQTCHREPLFRRRCWRPNRQDNPSVLGALHDSFLMLNPENQASTSDVAKYTKINGNDQCAWQTGGRYSSSCPHHFMLNFNENRRPKVLIEAKCNCDENTPCLNGTKASRCVPLKYYITVLRKNGCSGDTSTYTKAVEPITVGCTCAYQLPMDLDGNGYHVATPK